MSWILRHNSKESRKKVFWKGVQSGLVFDQYSQIELQTNLDSYIRLRDAARTTSKDLKKAIREVQD